MKNKSWHITFFLLFFTLISCSEFGSEPKDLISPQTLKKNIKDFNIQTVTKTSDSKLQNATSPAYFEIKIRFDESVRNYKLPDGLRLKNNSILRPSKENGLLYTSKISINKLKKLDACFSKYGKNVAADGPTVSCEVEFAWEGGTYCGETCSDDDAPFSDDVIFCVCMKNCSVGWQW